jgi:hypothetical protein
MSYEIRLFIAEKLGGSPLPSQCKHTGDNEAEYCRIIAKVDLSAPGHDTNIYQIHRNNSKNPAERAYCYAEDGNTVILRDRYNEALSVMSINEAIKALTADCRHNKYWRLKMARDMLKAFLAKVPETLLPNIRIVGYGY